MRDSRACCQTSFRPAMHLRTFVYLLTLLVCSSVLLSMSLDCLSKFMAGDTNIQIKVSPTGFAPMPGFTVCPHFEVAYKEEELVKMGLTVGQYIRGVYPTNDIDLDPDDIFKKGTKYRNLPYSTYTDKTNFSETKIH